MIPQTEAFRLEFAGRYRLPACDPAAASGAFRRVTGAIRRKHLTTEPVRPRNGRRTLAARSSPSGDP